METKEIIWLSQKINEDENKGYISDLLKECNLKIIPFKNLNDLLQLMETNIFKMHTAIVSGRLFPEYIKSIENNINLFIVPLTLIFTLNKVKFKKEIDKDYLKFLEHKYFNPLGIVDSYKDLKKTILETISKLNNSISLIKLGNTPNPINYKECLTFEYLTDKTQLIFPYLYQKIMSKSQIDYDSTENFNKFLLENFGENYGIKKLLQVFYMCKDIPEQLIAKYWGKIYTLETSFYKNINWNLMTLNNKNYNPFIQLFYSGFKEYSFNFEKEKDKILYRGTNINNEEIQKILEFYNKDSYITLNDNDFQKGILVYSRAFLSFSTNQGIAKSFMKNINGTTKVFFKLENNLKSEIISNADFRKINSLNENEILFFPFSAFIIKKISFDKDHYIIEINYLGIYEKIIKIKIEEIKDKPELIEEISQNTELSKDVFASEIMINKNIDKNFEETSEIKEKNEK